MNIKMLEYYRSVLDPDHAFVGHAHDTFEINIVLQGCLEVTVREKVVRLNPGDMAVWNAMMFHHDRVNSEHDTEYLAIHFVQNEEILPRDRVNFYRLNYHNLQLVQLLDTEITENASRITEAAEKLLDVLLLRAEKDRQTPAYSQRPDAIVYQNAVCFMQDHICNSCSLSSIAHHCGVCETTLKNVFHKFTGKSVKQYFQTMKMLKAMELLLSGKSAKEVTTILGYSSLSYFSQSFKRENGCTVREYIGNRTQLRDRNEG